MAKTVGITTTIPVEVLLAAEVRPVDLNNIFITDERAAQLVTDAELAGYPRNVCAWVKGIYATVKEKDIETVIAVTQGDCSQNQAMVETLKDNDVDVFHFNYPARRDRQLLDDEMQRLMDYFGTDRQAAEAMRRELIPLRRQLAKIDRLTWREELVTGFENHYYLVNASDFTSDIEHFQKQVSTFIEKTQTRNPRTGDIRIGVIGVPTIITDFYDVLEKMGARVVFNEMQRQFAMTPYLECDLLKQYLCYTYPYPVTGRIADITREIERRDIDGIIHYVQTFCYRQIQGLLIRRQIPVPVLMLEANRPAPMDARNRLRVQAFMETLEVQLEK